jgi:hypothetical protein
LQPFTCEWLARPDVAFPEYSDTITSNFPVLEEDSKKVLRKDERQDERHDDPHKIAQW